MTTSALKLRDRDAIITKEGIIFRVYGYTHPMNGYVCDPEYAPKDVYQSTQTRALRQGPDQTQVYYKFYADEGLRFIHQNYPRYMVLYRPLGKRLVGVKKEDIDKVREPQGRFQELIQNPPGDELVSEMQALDDILRARTNLKTSDFGVFGSLLHGFYDPRYSDLDFIVYGRTQLKRLQQLLEQSNEENGSRLANEFSDENSIMDKAWQFKNYTPKEYVWHQKRKLIYTLFRGKTRTLKAEFEPVKRWEEIQNAYNPKQRISRKGWIKARARITDDKDASFMPSIYEIEPLEGIGVRNVHRILSYVEEFRLQAGIGEIVDVEGNLEEVTTDEEVFQQITLTYGPRYYEQVLKVSKLGP